MTKIRTGQAPAPLTRAEFHERFKTRFYDPAFEVEAEAIQRLETIAWQAMQEGRKAPITKAAGRGYADPSYEVSVQWLETHKRLRLAQKKWADTSTAGRVLLICGSARNDGTCPGEVSKTWRLTGMAQQVVEAADMQADVLDLSLVTSEYGRNIHPCKGCVSSAMPLCHWPCSCYPNHALAQSDDWMAEIYERWVAAHAIIILAPTYWYQSPSPLKLMIDRMVCADGGNPDPTSTQGKNPKMAKEIELAGWPYPRHLAGRVFSVVAHGDAAGVETLARNLSDWLSDLGMIAAGHKAVLGTYVGYLRPYATSHDDLDRDTAFQDEVAEAAKSLIEAVGMMRAGKLRQPGAGLREIRPK